MQEMSSGDAGIGYDMDSSLCIYDTKTQDVFFNSVDNPLSLKITDTFNRLAYRRFISLHSRLAMPVNIPNPSLVSIERKKGFA